MENIDLETECASLTHFYQVLKVSTGKLILGFWRFFGKTEQALLAKRIHQKIRWLRDGFVAFSVFLLRILLADIKRGVFFFFVFVVKTRQCGCSLPEDAHTPHVFPFASLVHKIRTQTRTHAEKSFNIHEIHTLHRDESVSIVGGDDVKGYSKYSLYQSVKLSSFSFRVRYFLRFSSVENKDDAMRVLLM